MRVCLVNMPWHLLDLPSLALSILEQAALETMPGAQVDVRYANVSWADYVYRTTDGNLNPDLYNRVSIDGISCSLGDWVFGTALWDEPWDDKFFFRYLPASESWPLDELITLRRLAPDFVRSLAAEIVADGVTVVGLTTTFTQNIPALSLAKQLKTIAPEITIVFGGANCDGPQGAALHRRFPFIDYLIRGEAEASFPALLKFLNDGEQLPDIPGLCHRGPDGQSVVDERHPSLVALSDTTLTPRFTSYLQQIDASSIRPFIRPKAIVESSRGCWWGEKSHCTFCGLNGATMKFRSKSPATVVKEIRSAAADCLSLDIFMVDNILDMNYFDSLLPMLSQEPYDYCLHYEIKSNISLKQVNQLRQGKVFHVQPGIESLTSSVLRSMRKGVTGWQNLRFLRDCQAVGITVTWNLLYGFPDEREEDYEAVLRQLPFLFHLAPPAEVVRFSIQRFSPYFNNPELGFAGKKVGPNLEHIYHSTAEQLSDLVHLFSAPQRGITEDCARKLHAVAEEWLAAYKVCELKVESHEQMLTVHDTRPFNAGPTDYVIDDPLMTSAYHHLRGGCSVAQLSRLMKHNGQEVSAASTQAILSELERLGLVFCADDQVHIALGTESESAHTLEEMIEIVLPTEKSRIKRKVSPKFYWRRGPGFIQIQDERFISQSIYLVEEQEISLFEKLSTPFRYSDLTADEAEVFARFEAAELVSRINDWAFVLPYRKRSWQAGEVQQF